MMQKSDTPRLQYIISSRSVDKKEIVSREWSLLPSLVKQLFAVTCAANFRRHRYTPLVFMVRRHSTRKLKEITPS
jgi:hypothetical protein